MELIQVSRPNYVFAFNMCSIILFSLVSVSDIFMQVILTGNFKQLKTRYLVTNNYYGRRANRNATANEIEVAVTNRDNLWRLGAAA